MQAHIFVACSAVAEDNTNAAEARALLKSKQLLAKTDWPDETGSLPPVIWVR